MRTPHHRSCAFIAIILTLPWISVPSDLPLHTVLSHGGVVRELDFGSGELPPGVQLHGSATLTAAGLQLDGNGFLSTDIHEAEPQLGAERCPAGSSSGRAGFCSDQDTSRAHPRPVSISDMTMEVWLNAKPTDRPVMAMTVTSANGALANETLAVWRHPSRGFVLAGLSSMMEDGNLFCYGTLPAEALAGANGMLHLVATVSNNAEATIYGQGKPIQINPQANCTKPFLNLFLAQQSQMLLGTELAGSNGMHGQIKCVRLYNRQLTATEVQQSHDAGPCHRAWSSEQQACESCDQNNLLCINCRNMPSRPTPMDTQTKAIAAMLESGQLLDAEIALHSALRRKPDDAQRQPLLQLFSQLEASLCPHIRTFAQQVIPDAV